MPETIHLGKPVPSFTPFCAGFGFVVGLHYIEAVDCETCLWSAFRREDLDAAIGRFLRIDAARLVLPLDPSKSSMVG